MTHLIIPAAGASSRFGYSKPKFLLQHPDGCSMLAAGLAQLASLDIERILIVSLSTFFQDVAEDRFLREVSTVSNCHSELLLLDRPTRSMVETLIHGVRTCPPDSPILIKDSDNLVAFNPADSMEENFIVTADIDDFPNFDPRGKSSVVVDTSSRISAIEEKRLVSNHVNTGMVCFRKSRVFLESASKCRNEREIFTSDVVSEAIRSGETFMDVSATSYEDWGTASAWQAFRGDFVTLFVDVDGVVAENEDPLSQEGGWERFRPINPNVSALLALERSRRAHIVFTTARSENFRSSLDSSLRGVGFERFDLLCGLPHARRVLVNDYAKTNPYPSALAINLPRNSPTLESLLASQLEGVLKTRPLG